MVYDDDLPNESKVEMYFNPQNERQSSMTNASRNLVLRYQSPENIIERLQKH